MQHEVQVAENYYNKKKYGTLERFISYYHQVDSLRQYAGKKVLFVGVGDGLVPHYLRHVAGVEVTTLDFDASLGPDIIADVRTLPCEDASFDAIAVFEVLEHLPFDDFEPALAELARVSKGDVIVSVPYRHTGLDLVLKFPYIRTLLKRDYLRLLLTLPIRFPGIEVSKQHYWEIDSGKTPFSVVRASLRKYFAIDNEHSSFFDAYRHFFILKKKGMSKEALTDEFVRDYYDSHLQKLDESYTTSRWEQSPVARFDYRQTLRALRHALAQLPKRKQRVLEVGPGDGVWTRTVLPFADSLTLLDQSSEMISRAQEALEEHDHITYHIGDFLAFAPDTEYELIQAMRCFEYFEDKPRAAEQFKKLLAPGGTAIIVTKNAQYVSQKGKTQKRLHRGQLSRGEFITLFREHGLSVDAVYPATYRWKASWAPMRWLFTASHGLAVATNGLVRIPWLEERATESYCYIVRKPV